MTITTLRSFALAALACVLTAACSNNDNDDKKCRGVETPSERLFLQQLSDTSVVIKWRGEATAACIGTLQDKLNIYGEANETESGDKEVLFTDLKPEIQYWYSIGAARTAPDDQSFVTAPEVGALPADRNTRVWLIGDSGTGGDDEREAMRERRPRCWRACKPTLPKMASRWMFS